MHGGDDTGFKTDGRSVADPRIGHANNRQTSNTFTTLLHGPRHRAASRPFAARMTDPGSGSPGAPASALAGLEGLVARATWKVPR